ncbi:MAG: hypothetical protein AABY26_05650 [Nanoarchaeota archaeon]
MKTNVFLRFWGLIVLLLLINLVGTLAISITPSGQDIPYEPGTSKTVQFTTSGMEEVEISVSGPLAEYAKLLTPAKMSGCANTACTIQIQIDIPDLSQKSPGINSLTVSAREMQSNVDPFGGSGISALVQINGIVKMVVPYPGRYALVKLKAVKESVDVGTAVPFIAEVTNYGNENIPVASGKMYIYPLGSGEKEYSLDLSSVENIPPMEVGQLKGLWNTKEVLPGRYGAIVNVSYGGAEQATGKLFGIEVGDKVAKVMGISPNTLEPGKVQKITFTVESFWNEEMEVYVHSKLKDVNNVLLTEGDSKSIKLGRGEGKIDTFLDLSEVKEGDYTVEAITKFGDALEHTESFPLKVVSVVKSASPDEAAKAGSAEEEGSSSGWIVIIVIVVIALAAGAGFYFYRKNQEEDGEI